MGRRREQTMKKIRKTLTICLTASVLAVSSAVSASAAAFKDVSGHWAETTINRWVGLGYINGYPDGTFRPKEPITRTEFAVVANNAFNYQNVQAIYFPDVATTFWGYTEIQKAYAAGYMRGDANGTFRPKANVTRQEAAVMLANIKGLPVGGIAPYFSDSNSISSWARGSVNAVVSAGYMSGYPDGSFRPKSQISRAEVVTMLNNALGAGGTVSKPNVPPTQSTTDTVQNMTLSNTTLRNTIVNGDLTIPSSMSSKSITLDNVTVRGKLNVEGGGTITAKDCVVNELVMDKSSAIFHGDNGTSVAKTTFRANGTLEGSRFEDVSVANSKVNTVTIDAEVENLTLDTDADVRLYGGAEVETFDITKNADDALIEFSRGSRVRNMNVRDNVRIAGKGDIDNMAVYVSGVRSEIEPDSLSRKNGASKPDFDWEYDGKRHESSGSSSSSSSGTDKTVSKNFDGDGAKFRNVRVTDRAKLEDMRITGDLTIEEEVENETVRLVDLEIDGDVYIYGGGENSVIFEDCEIDGNIISDKDSKASKSETVALEFDSKTKVRGEILIRNHTILKEGSGSPKLKDVVVEEKNVELDVNIDIETLELERYAEVAVSNGVTIDTLKINSKVSGKPEIDLSNTAVIKTLDARSDVKVTGNGTVNNVKEGSGAKVELGSNIKHEPDDTKPGSVTSVTLDKVTTGVEIGKEIKLEAKVAVPDDKTDKTVIWSSSDKTIATVSADGTVKGVAVGTATITATAKADSTKKATCQVKVAKEGELPDDPDKPVDPDKPLTEPRINPAVVEVQKSATTTLTLEIPEDYPVWYNIEWSVSGDANVVTLVDDTSTTDKTKKRISASQVGKTTVTAKISDKDGSTMAAPSCEVIVTASTGESPLTGVNIGVSEKGPIVGNLNVKVGTNTTQLAAMLVPDKASFSSLHWSSSDPSVVDPNLKDLTSGTRTYLDAKKVGEGVTITLTAMPSNPAEGETGFTATCMVNVTADGANVPVESVAITPSISLEEEETKKLTATVKPDNATDKTVTWSSNNPAAATVDQSGNVTAVAAGKGTATITAVAVGANGATVKAECTVTVTPKTSGAVTGVRLDNGTLTLSSNGANGTLTATVEPTNAANQNVTWSVVEPSEAGVIEISPTDKICTVKPKKAGTAKVKVTTQDGNHTATCDVTVNPAGQPSENVTITLPPEQTIEMLPTGKDTLTANVAPANAQVTWNSSDTAIATVNPTSGEITAVMPGKATITATATADGKSATANCEVSIKPGLEITYKGTDTPAAEPDGTIDFNIQVKPTDADIDYGVVNDQGKDAGWGDGKVISGATDLTLKIPDTAVKGDYKLVLTAVPNGTTGSPFETEKTIDFKVLEKTSQTAKVTITSTENKTAAPGEPIEYNFTVEPAGTTDVDFTFVVKKADATLAGTGWDNNPVHDANGTITVNVPDDAPLGAYTLEVSATNATIEPNPAVLSFNVSPTLTIQERDFTIKQGETKTIQVDGSSPTGYRIAVGVTVKQVDVGNTPPTDINIEAITHLDNQGFDIEVKAGALPGTYTLTVERTDEGMSGHTASDSTDFTVAANAGNDESETPDSIAPVRQEEVQAAPQPATPPRTFSFIPQREIQSKPAAPAVTVEPEQKQEPEKEPEKVQEPVKEPAKEPEKVQEPEKEPEKVQEPEPEQKHEQKHEQKQGIALTCADSFKAGETLTLSGTVNGVSSAMRKIDWSIRDAGATGAAIRDGVMSAEQAGTVTIAATVQNSTTTEYFTITVLPGEPKNDAPETQEPEQTPTEPQEPAEGGQPNAPAEPVTPVVPVEPDGQTPVVTPPAVQVGTVTLPNGQVITNAKKYQRNVGAVIALNGLDTLPANAAADSVVWEVESFGATGAALQALDNTLVNVNAKGVILLSRTVRVTDANGNAAIATTYFEITIV